MNNKSKKIINLIVLIIVAILAFVFVKNVPSILTAIQTSKIEAIEKIGEKEASAELIESIDIISNDDIISDDDIISHGPSDVISDGPHEIISGDQTEEEDTDIELSYKNFKYIEYTDEYGKHGYVRIYDREAYCGYRHRALLHGWKKNEPDDEDYEANYNYRVVRKSDLEKYVEETNKLTSDHWESSEYDWTYNYNYGEFDEERTGSWSQTSSSTVNQPVLESFKYYHKSYATKYTTNDSSDEYKIIAFAMTQDVGYTEAKQDFAWASTELNRNRPVESSTHKSDQLINWAKKFLEFKKSISDNHNSILVDGGDATDQSKVEILENRRDSLYVVGPFKINYIKCDYGGLAFGGITDMYIVDEYGSKIDIEYIVLDGETVTPKYFDKGDNEQVVDKRGNLRFPDPNQEFYVKFRYDGWGNPEQINYLHVEFGWMSGAEVTIVRYKGEDAKMYKTTPISGWEYRSEKRTSSDIMEGTEEKTYYSTRLKNSISIITQTANSQDLLVVRKGSAKRYLTVGESLNIPIPNNPPPPPVSSREKNTYINLAGHVWEDEKTGKDQKADGVRETSNKGVPGVLVHLYQEGEGEIKHTVTDSEGYYEFTNLNATKKYYFKYDYDGQLYQATKYYRNGESVNGHTINDNGSGSASQKWTSDPYRLTGRLSTATENESDRVEVNKTFAEIGSSPGNYQVRTHNSAIGYNSSTNRVWFMDKTSSENKYGIKDLYDYVKQKLYEYRKHDDPLSDAYRAALSYTSDAASKLQFIDDCRISAWSGINGSKITFPVYDYFVESEKTIASIGSEYYNALYPSHYNIDFGITRRETFDLAIRKDVLQAVVEINGKSHVYKYDQRGDSEGSAWDINIRLSDGYYNRTYERELYAEDYQYKVSQYGNYRAYGKTKDDELKVYVTYKMTVRNQSDIVGAVTEMVDYYDGDYTFVPSRSYYKIAKKGDAREIYTSTASRYGSANSSTMHNDNHDYKTLYVTGFEDVKLSSGEQLYVFLTFSVDKDTRSGEQWIKLDETISGNQTSLGKENLVEINGYKTYYYSGAYVPNIGTRGKDTVAGIIDSDSMPGNLEPDVVRYSGSIDYSEFEDDTDKAPNIRLILYRNLNELAYRQVDGYVWEDEKNLNNNTQASVTGNGKRDSGEATINGVTVQFVELMDNGTEYLWKEFSSGQNRNGSNPYTPIISKIGYGTDTYDVTPAGDKSNGKYIFRSYVPGNYIVRFYYGDTLKTVLTSSGVSYNGMHGENAKSYNGQDYQSTVYQRGVNQNASAASKVNEFIGTAWYTLGLNPDKYWVNENGRLTYIWRQDSHWELDKMYLGDEITRVQTFKADCSNNETVNAWALEQNGYLYDITESQNAGVSDAKDMEARRNSTIPYSINDVRNNLAEILASPQQGAVIDSSQINSKIDALLSNTWMQAETGMMVLECEYDSQESAYEKYSNGTYFIKDVDLGLQERPKAQLAMNKEVTNVRVSLADGSTLFDANQKVTNVLWRDHKPYSPSYSGNRLNGINILRNQSSWDAAVGLIQMSMDTELMHGATIKISYKITVTNVGEVDYQDTTLHRIDRKFYYTGTKSNTAKIVTTRANVLTDYVSNNLQFYQADNNGIWKVIEKDQLFSKNYLHKVYNDKNIIGKFNVVLTTDANANIPKTDLVPKLYSDKVLGGKGTISASDELVLTQLITPENDTDDLTYTNIVEISSTNNDMGRRNAFSIVGNQNPTLKPQEADTDISQTVKILPPYGNGGINYIIAGIVLVSSLILIAGIVFTKKFILKK